MSSKLPLSPKTKMRELEDNMDSLRLTDRRLEHAHSSDLGEETEEEEEDSPETSQIRRSSRLRSRIRPLLPEKRRVLTKPIKIPDSKLNNIENYYLDKRVKRLHLTLETIYEETHQLRNQDVYMSSKKFQRKINFSAAPSKDVMKVKKRKLKAKHMNANRRANNKSISIKFLLDKLSDIKDV